MKVPALVSRPRHWLWIGVLWAPYIALYQLTNRFPLRTPVELPLGALDRTLPFVPALLAVYVAYIPFYWWSVWRARDDAELSRMFYVTHLQLVISLTFFVLWPVRMPRELYYPAASLNWADAFWRWFDAPNNCFPSLHVSNCLALVVFNWPKKGRAVCTALALAIIASTVLVKQHYVVDVLGGAGVFAVSWLMLRGLDVTADATHRRKFLDDDGTGVATRC